jgi:hypothetical protein
LSPLVTEARDHAVEEVRQLVSTVVQVDVWVGGELVTGVVDRRADRHGHHPG